MLLHHPVLLESDDVVMRVASALRQVIDHYRGSALSGVIMFTDGVTTRDETVVPPRSS